MVWGHIKRRCLRIQDITAGKNFRKYLVQHLNLATEETQIESKPIGPKQQRSRTHCDLGWDKTRER